MKYLFLLNSSSSGVKVEKLRQKIESRMKKTDIDYEILVMDDKEESLDIARKRLDQGYKCLVAVGGDGTIQHFAPVVAEKDRVLGILPAGTANDFIKALGWSENFDENMDRLIRGNIKKVDYGMANKNLFINTASVGFDADVIKIKDKIKPYIKSKLSYYLAVLASFIRYRKIEIKFEEYNDVKKNFLFVITNGKYYGGGFKISPKSLVDDGYLDLIMANNVSKFKILTIVPSFVSGKHIYNKNVVYKRIKNYSIKPKENFTLNLDGELKEYREGSIINFEIVEEGLKIIN